MLMAENARTAFVWETFMKNPEAQRGMAVAGFQTLSRSIPVMPWPERTGWVYFLLMMRVSFSSFSRLRL